MNASFKNFKSSKNVVVETELPKALVRSKKKRVHDERIADETPTDVKTNDKFSKRFLVYI